MRAGSSERNAFSRALDDAELSAALAVRSTVPTRCECGEVAP